MKRRQHERRRRTNACRTRSLQQGRRESGLRFRGCEDKRAAITLNCQHPIGTAAPRHCTRVEGVILYTSERSRNQARRQCHAVGGSEPVGKNRFAQRNGRRLRALQSRPEIVAAKPQDALAHADAKERFGTADARDVKSALPFSPITQDERRALASGNPVRSKWGTGSRSASSSGGISARDSEANIARSLEKDYRRSPSAAAASLVTARLKTTALRSMMRR